MHNNSYHRIAECALIAGFALLGVAGCSRGVGGPVYSGTSAIPSSAQSTISTANSEPKSGAPAWCDKLDNPAVIALADVLPQLVTDQASAAAPKVHSAATVLRAAGASAPAQPRRLLADAAGSLEAAADAKSAASLQAVATAFASLSKGVQSACGFH
jgi:hypothetical protein